jgi:hypothetical protein
MNYIKKEFKKLVPICLMIFCIGWTHSIGLGLSLAGFILLLEHMWSYARWDIKDILGHENLGIILLLIGLFLLGNYPGMIISLITYLVFAKYKWEDINPIKYAWAKINKVWSM